MSIGGLMNVYIRNLTMSDTGLHLQLLAKEAVKQGKPDLAEFADRARIYPREPRCWVIITLNNMLGQPLGTNLRLGGHDR